MDNKDLENIRKQITIYLERALEMMHPFDKQAEKQFYVWLNEFEYVTNNIRVPNNRMIDIFNLMVDKDIHMSIRNNYPSNHFINLSYDQITEHYFNHFKYEGEHPYQSRFYYRYQYEGEPIILYAHNLIKLSRKCGFSDDIDEKLCQQFINGVRNQKLKEYLTLYPNLKFYEMVHIANEFNKN